MLLQVVDALLANLILRLHQEELFARDLGNTHDASLGVSGPFGPSGQKA